ncbi:Homeodomain-like superfamily protein [Zea mays]|jgi:hypothetical protein|uniref:Homeodomain-like superfamily protein n=1 Tax=Zea mays TaxID=4577 RepID=B4FA23_MAIZE|nr:unknown [Zea mays]ACN33354.1 unknown [Zea mays]AQK73284.1 Homeodomain-like superfamily protein [Zea mays]
MAWRGDIGVADLSAFFLVLAIYTALLGLQRKLCLVCTRRAATTFRRRFSFLKVRPRRPAVCVFVRVVEALRRSAWLNGVRVVEALRHSAWLDGVRAFVALGVCSLPEFDVVDLCSW